MNTWITTTELQASITDGYEGGKVTRRHGNFRPTNRTADAQINDDWELITARGRWLGRNNPWCRGAKWTITDNTLGEGLQTRAMVRNARGEMIKEWNKQANELYRRVLDELDVTGHQHFFQLERTGLMTTVEAGEVYYIIRNDAEGFRRGRRLIPLAFEIVEPDQLDTSVDRPMGQDENEIRRGIEFDSDGRRVAYYFFTDHPGELHPNFIFRSERVPAERVLPLFRSERSTQTRGITWYSPIITNLWNLYEYQSAEIDAHKVRSYFVYMWKRENPSGFGLGHVDDSEDSAPLDLFGNSVESVAPGIALQGGPNDALEAIQSSNGSSEATQWIKLLLQTMGVGLHLGYSKMTGDFSNSSWSSLRSEDLNDQRGFGPVRNWHAWYVDLAIRKLATQQMIALELLPIPNGGVSRFSRNPNRWLACQFIPPRSGYLNPREEINAAGDAIRLGLSNWDLELAARGLVAEEVHQQAAEELGLTLDEYRRDVLIPNLGVPGNAGAPNANVRSGLEDSATND